LGLEGFNPKGSSYACKKLLKKQSFFKKAFLEAFCTLIFNPFAFY
jgi:hypothetical protein